MTIQDATPRVSPDALRDLSRFVRQQSARTAREVGFGWVAVDNAPSTYQQLRGAYARSTLTHEHLPVSSLFSKNTIYALREDNFHFRFWHDVHHVKLGVSFSLDDELELALWHLDQAELAGYPKGSDVYQLLSGDLIGQLLLMAMIRRFPIEQGDFVEACHQVGLLPALLDEIRRVP